MANGKKMQGTYAGNEEIKRVALGDPRSGEEKLGGLVNRVMSGNRTAPVRRYDDTPTQMAQNRAKSKK